MSPCSLIRVVLLSSDDLFQYFLILRSVARFVGRPRAVKGAPGLGRGDLLSSERGKLHGGETIDGRSIDEILGGADLNGRLFVFVTCMSISVSLMDVLSWVTYNKTSGHREDCYGPERSP